MGDPTRVFLRLSAGTPREESQKTRQQNGHGEARRYLAPQLPFGFRFLDPVQQPVQLLLTALESFLHLSSLRVTALDEESHPGDEAGQQGARKNRERAYFNPGEVRPGK